MVRVPHEEHEKLFHVNLGSTGLDPTLITGLVLAGGRATRMGGLDKGLQPFHGTPLALHALNRLRRGAGVGALALNANRHLDDYRAFGVPVWPDADASYAGPLAGFLAGLTHCQTPYLLTVPCDAPLFPLDLAQRLGAALQALNADLALAMAPPPEADDAQPFLPQPVFCLLSASLLPSLREFIDHGGHKVQAWIARHRAAQACFNQPGDDHQAFANANTLAELQRLAQAG